MGIRSLVCRSVWSTALFGSLLVGCGGEVGVNQEGSEPAESAAVLEAFSPAADAPDQEVHSAALSCPGGLLTWSQMRSAWNANAYTAGTYYCDANIPGTSHGFVVSATASSAERNGSAQLYCNNGTWQWMGGSCDGKVVSTTTASGTSTVCSHWEPVRSLWISWYLADLKRCADSAGLEWWVTQYNNNAACHASNNYDGYGTKDACWRAHFRTAANNNGNSYNEAQATGHIAFADEFSMCGPRASYPWTSVSANGTQCKYRP